MWKGRGNKDRQKGKAASALSLVQAGFIILLSCPPAAAVITFDLLHDTPETRELLKEELGSAVYLPESPSSDAGITPLTELEAIWFAREKFLQIGELEKAEGQLRLIWEKQMEKGIRNLPGYGAVLVREARRNIQRGYLERAETILSMARKMAPDYPAVYLVSSEIVLKKGLWNVIGVLQELREGFRSVLRSFHIQSWVLANVFFTILAGLGFFFAFSIGAMLIRTAGRIVHDIGELLPSRFAPRIRTVLAWMIFMIPVFIGLPPLWWFVLGGMLVWAYVGLWPRVLLFLAAAYLLVLPGQIRVASSFLTMHQQPLLEKVVAVRGDHWSTLDYDVLRELVKKNEATPLAYTALGLAAKRLGRFKEADQYYRQALEFFPDDPVLWNNLGNLALIRKEADDVVQLYRRAIELAPDLFAPHYNLSLAYREKFLFSEGETESRRALEIDPAANAYYSSLSGTHFNRNTVDALPALKSIWALALSENTRQAAAAKHLWAQWKIPLAPAIWPFFVIGVVLLGLGAWVFRARRGAAQACQRCGRIFCPLCQRTREGDLCSQCHHIFIKKEGIEARIRVQKMTAIKKHRRIQKGLRLLSAFLAPGGGHLVAGRFWWGMVFLLPASFFEARVLLGQGKFPSTWYLYNPWLTGFIHAGAVLFVVWWALSLWLTYRLEE
jgi:tetratricopeptide (TPR) repeat protein